MSGFGALLAARKLRQGLADGRLQILAALSALGAVLLVYAVVLTAAPETALAAAPRPGPQPGSQPIPDPAPESDPEAQPLLPEQAMTLEEIRAELASHQLSRDNSADP